MNQNLVENVQVLFQKVHVEALLNNRNQQIKWEAYEKELTQTGERLKLFLKDLSVPVLVPVGNKALFRGKLVHTNDVTISLGDGYFIKGSVEQALEIIGRRLARCQETLGKLNKERELLESRVSFKAGQDVFPEEGSKEIIEEYVEDEEESWRQEHRNKVRDYRRRLSEMKKEQPTKIQTDEDLWKRLDMLEMEEELDDELNRLGAGSDSSSESSDSDTCTDSTDQDMSLEIESKSNLPDLSKPPGPSIIKKSSSTDNHNQSQVSPNNNSPCNDYIKINFNHSDVKPVIELSKDTINSPYDIYAKFSEEQRNKNRKLSRRVSFADAPEIKLIASNTDVSSVEPVLPDQPLPTAFGDVVERTVPMDVQTSETRPVSKFKSSRIQKKPL